jgi:hypothetical protein
MVKAFRTRRTTARIAKMMGVVKAILSGQSCVGEPRCPCTGGWWVLILMGSRIQIGYQRVAWLEVKGGI